MTKEFENNTKKELHHHDMVFVFSQDKTPQFFIGEELQLVIQEIVRAHKEFYIKINWWSPDLILLLPSEVAFEETEQPK